MNDLIGKNFLFGIPEINIMMPHLVQIIDAGLMDIIKKRHGHDPIGINSLAMSDIIADDRTAKTMLRYGFGILNAGHPPAGAFNSF